MDRILKVKGTGKIKIKPDTTSLAVDMRGTLTEYAAAVEASTRRANELANALVGAGFDRDFLKTVNFDVSAKYDYVRDRQGNNERRFIGYEYVHSLKYEMPISNERLSAFLSVLTRFDFGFSFRFTVKDVDVAKNALLADAIGDAMVKAKTLAESAGVRLGQIVEIVYGASEPELRTRAFLACDRSDAPAAQQIAVDLNPEDVTATDTVTVVWAIA